MVGALDREGATGADPVRNRAGPIHCHITTPRTYDTHPSFLHE